LCGTRWCPNLCGAKTVRSDGTRTPEPLVAAWGFFTGFEAKVTSSGQESKGCPFFVPVTTVDGRRPVTPTVDDAQKACPDWGLGRLTTTDDDG